MSHTKAWKLPSTPMEPLEPIYWWVLTVLHLNSTFSWWAPRTSVAIYILINPTQVASPTSLLCVGTWYKGVSMWHSPWLEDMLWPFGSLLSFCGFQRLNSSHQACLASVSEGSCVTEDSLRYHSFSFTLFWDRVPLLSIAPYAKLAGPQATRESPGILP